MAEARVRITAEDKTGRAFNSAKGRLNELKKSTLALRSAISGITGVALFRSLDALGKAAFQQNRIFLEYSERIGASAGALSEFAVAGDLAGVSAQQINAALQRSTRRVGEAAKGYGEARRALDELNLSAVELSQLSADQQFNRIADALINVENRTERLTLAFKLFDSEGAAVVQTLDDLQRAQEIARRTGAVITDREIRSMEAFRQETAETEAAWRAFGQAFIDTDIPRSIENIKQGIIGLGTTGVNVLSATGKAIGAIGASIGAAVTGDFDRVLLILREFNNDLDEIFAEQTPSSAVGGAAAFNNIGNEIDKTLTKNKKSFSDITAEIRTQNTDIQSQLEGWNDVFRTVQKINEIESDIGRALTATEQQEIRNLIILGDSLNEQLDARNRKLREQKEAQAEVNQGAQELGFTFSSAFEDAVIGGNNLRDVLKGLQEDVLRIAFRKTVTEPLAEFVTGAVSGFNIPFFGSGTRSAPGGLAIVGDRGPELVNLPRGSQVTPNNQMGNLGSTTIIQVPVNASVDITPQSAGQAGFDFARQIEEARGRNG